MLFVSVPCKSIMQFLFNTSVRRNVWLRYSIFVSLTNTVKYFCLWIYPLMVNNPAKITYCRLSLLQVKSSGTSFTCSLCVIRRYYNYGHRMGNIIQLILYNGVVIYLFSRNLRCINFDYWSGRCPVLYWGSVGWNWACPRCCRKRGCHAGSYPFYLNLDYLCMHICYER